jgi:hypothetical protein
MPGNVKTRWKAAEAGNQRVKALEKRSRRRLDPRENSHPERRAREQKKNDKNVTVYGR